jgi:hypothetical protein
MDFFYDNQVRRYLLQFMRIFSDFSIQSGPDENGTLTQTRVPILYGNPSWMVAQILKGQSQNTAMPSPMMAAWIVEIKTAPDRRQDPANESKVNAIERNSLGQGGGGGYGQKVGNRYTIDRYMPVPYDLTMQVDIWTTTTTTKLQLLEQILTIFNPSIQLQQNSNKLDWTSIFEVELTQVTWSNNGVPSGPDQPREVASLQFKVPIWINPPAKVKRIKIIEEIVVNVNAVKEIPDHEVDSIFNSGDYLGDRMTQLIVTPGMYRIGVGTNGLQKNEVILLTKYGVADPTLSWKSLFEAYGDMELNETILRLKLDPDIENFDNDVLGNLIIDPLLPSNIARFEVDIDTLPSTIKPVIDIINPGQVFPGRGLPAAIAGQRYLLVSDLTNGEEPAIPINTGLNPWGTITAYENDIIEYTGTNWVVSFSSRVENRNQYVINLRSMNHYKFTGDDWVFTYLGEYFPGYFRFENIHANDSGTGTSPSDLC